MRSTNIFVSLITGQNQKLNLNVKSGRPENKLVTQKEKNSLYPSVLEPLVDFLSVA